MCQQEYNTSLWTMVSRQTHVSTGGKSLWTMVSRQTHVSTGESHCGPRSAIRPMCQQEKVTVDHSQPSDPCVNRRKSLWTMVSHQTHVSTGESHCGPWSAIRQMCQQEKVSKLHHCGPWSAIRPMCPKQFTAKELKFWGEYLILTLGRDGIQASIAK